MAERGFDGAQMGVIFGMTPVVALLAQPVWGILADALSMRRRLLTAACVLAAIAAIPLGLVQGFWPILIAMLVLTVVRSPILAISNAITLETLGPQRELFPQIRAWGSLAYAIIAVFIGWWVMDRSLTWTVWLFALGMLLTALASRRLPSSHAPIIARWWTAFDFVRHDRGFQMFLLAMVTMQFTNPIANAYLPLIFRDLAAPTWMTGAAWAIAAGLEAPLMGLAPRLIRRYGVERVMVALTLATPLRWLLYLFINNPVWILPLQALFSFSATAFFAAAVTYIDSLSPPRWRATAQSLYIAVIDSLGVGLGSLVFGWLYQQGGLRVVLTVALVVASAGWLMLLGYTLTRKKAS